LNLPVKKNKSLISIPLYLISLAVFLLSVSCVRAKYVTDIKPIIDSLKIKESSQALIVTNNCSSSYSANVYALEKKDNKWEKVGDAIEGVIGKNGFADPGEKREGDGKSPSGIFRLKMAFGYDESIRTKMPYRQASSEDLWIDDVNAVDYNHWVKKEDTQAASYEKMKRDDNLYKYGIVVEYNTNPVIKGYGSAIFIHVWGGENTATGGCVAVAEDNLIRILDWLDPQALPVIVMGTENTIERLGAVMK
jgi:L,D-peptidoglycan transpeptidase YkuD (ErfK/YbiS/YcfS/YnhG family)